MVIVTIISKFMAKKIFIGVAWPYVNGDIHIGHLAGYLLPADIFARFHRLRGNGVLMVSGSDAHGTPITVEADKRGVSPEEIVSEYHKKIVELFDFLKLSFDNFTSTTTKNHEKLAQDIFLTALKKGYIFKNKTDQYYSPDEERFLPDRYIEGVCPHCEYEGARSDQCENCGRVLEPGELKKTKSKIGGSALELRETEHYFFDWPKLEKFLEGYIKEKGSSWRKWVLKETENWLKEGLKPRAITRDIEWGVPIPNDRIPEAQKIDGADKKRIYVWFEAVIGYLSASIEWANKNNKDWKQFWHDDNVEHTYFMGKDNLVFHTLFWPGELHVYDEKLNLPDKLFINQFLTLEGQKFSKSRGVIVDSDYIVREYGLDPVRFYLTSISPERADTNFSWTDFVEKHNNVLISTFGNFINRTLTLARGIDMSDELVSDEVEGKVAELTGKTCKSLEEGGFKYYVENLIALSDFGNKYLSEKTPWLIKDENERKKVLGNALFIVLALWLVSGPLLIETREKLSKILGVEAPNWPDDEISFLKSLLSKVKISEVKPLFSKIDEGVVEKETAKLRD